MTTTDTFIDTLFDGRYKILERIGSGGMANVYLAEDETLGRNVAIKILHPRYAEDEAFVERFMREAQAAAKLNHPNIVQVYDRGHSGDVYYIAMEYVDGTTLKQLIRERGALPATEVYGCGRQALAALRFAHRNGVVHRDVKSHNLLIDTEGQLKISDFGIARAGANSGLTEVGSIVGTAQYLSPEQAQGRTVAASSDLYSLGVVLFESITGQVPFDGDSPVNVALRHVNEPAPRASSIRKDVPPGLDEVIARAMEKDPARRYQSADEMLAELDAAREGTLAATTVLPAAAVAAAGPATSVMVPPPPLDEYTTSMPLDDPRREKNNWVWWLLAILLLAAIAFGAWWYSSQGNKVDVPDVIGLEERAARDAIQQVGLHVGTVDEEFSTKPKGTVIDEEPGAGESVEEDSEVDLVLSAGVEPVAVPDVVGKKRNEAVAAIKDAGFGNPKVKEVFDADAKPGIVTAQDPAGGTDVSPNSVITLTVSKGAEEVAVPSVIGLTEAEATSKLKAEGFDVNVETGADSNVPAGEVIDQSPTASTEAQDGSTVTITVSSGFNSVPDVTGQSEGDAQSALEEAGFSVTVDRIEDPSLTPGTEGVVTDMEPGAGERSEVGSDVTITVSEPPV